GPVPAKPHRPDRRGRRHHEPDDRGDPLASRRPAGERPRAAPLPPGPVVRGGRVGDGGAACGRADPLPGRVPAALGSGEPPPLEPGPPQCLGQRPASRGVPRASAGPGGGHLPGTPDPGAGLGIRDGACGGPARLRARVQPGGQFGVGPHLRPAGGGRRARWPADPDQRGGPRPPGGDPHSRRREGGSGWGVETMLPPLRMAVDDDPGIRYTLRGIARHVGWTMVTFPDGRTALHWLARRTPDAAIVDYHLPGENGLVLTRILREQYPDLPIVILTVDERQELADAFMAAGASDFALKPIRAPDLLARLRVHLRTRPGNAGQTRRAAPGLSLGPDPAGGRSLPKGIQGPTLERVQAI